MMLTPLVFIACSEEAPWVAPDAETTDATGSASADPQEVETRAAGEAEAGETEATAETTAEEAAPAPEPFCTGYDAPIRTGSLPAGLDEVSGMVASMRNPGVLWMIEDSGNEADVYAVTPAGTLVGVVHVAGVPNIDWEDLALAPCGEDSCLWVGDIGDNDARRGDLAMFRVREPIFDDEHESEQAPDVFPFAYPGGPQDAESLVVSGDGTPYVLTKRDDGRTQVYAIDAQGPGEVTEARAVAKLSTATDVEASGMRTRATGAAIWPDEGRLYVRTYGALWSWQLGEAGMEAVAEGVRAEVPAMQEIQGEAIAWDAGAAGYWQVSEGEGSAIWFTGCTLAG